MKSLFFSVALSCAIGSPYSLKAQCIQAGPLQATAFANNTGMGTVAWNNPALAGLSDNLDVQAGVTLSLFGSANTNYLTVQNCGFAIPAAATICGIAVSIERSTGGLIIGGSIRDAVVRIIRNGSISGTNHASAAAWPGSDAIATYGSASDLWGIAWTPTDINAADFGLALSATLNAGLASVFLSARVDQIAISVYYLNPALLTQRPWQAPQQALQVQSLTFYPNPVGNNITITGKRYTALITIKDLQGRVVKRYQVAPGVRMPQLSLQDIAPGQYLLEIDGKVLRLQKSGQE